VLFTLGMALTDTLNGLWVARLGASRHVSIAIAALCLPARGRQPDARYAESAADQRRQLRRDRWQLSCSPGAMEQSRSSRPPKARLSSVAIRSGC